MNTIQFKAAVCSGKGKRRAHNEDNYYFNGSHLSVENRDDDNFFSDSVEELSNTLFYGVFDGMGGESLGEEASMIVAETITEYHQSIKDKDHIDLIKTVTKAAKSANTQVCRKTEERKVKRMGATFTLLCIHNDSALLFNMGDSRAFSFSEGELEQISVDDTTVQRKIELGLITPEQALTDKDRHKINNFIGIPVDEGEITINISDPINIKKGDRFVVSSDGLTDMVTSERIKEILTQTEDNDETARLLFQEAMENGGRDNITVIVVTAMSDRNLDLLPLPVMAEAPEPELTTIAEIHDSDSNLMISEPPSDSSATSIESATPHKSGAAKAVIAGVLILLIGVAGAFAFLQYHDKKDQKEGQVSPSPSVSAEEETKAPVKLKESVDIQYFDLEPPSSFYMIENTESDLPDWEVEKGEKASLYSMIRLEPSYRFDEIDFSFESSDPDIISINPDTGQFTAKKEGEALLTVKLLNGKQLDEDGVNYLLDDETGDVMTPYIHQRIIVNGSSSEEEMSSEDETSDRQSSKNNQKKR